MINSASVNVAPSRSIWSVCTVSSSVNAPTGTALHPVERETHYPASRGEVVREDRAGTVSLGGPRAVKRERLNALLRAVVAVIVYARSILASPPL